MDEIVAIPHEWVPTVLVAFLGLMGVVVTAAWKSRDAHAAYNAARDKEHRDRMAADEQSEQDADVAQAQELTVRFKALMDGYESRIRDLSAEITERRGEMRDFRQRYESQQRVCRGCPYYEERMRNARPDRPTE